MGISEHYVLPAHARVVEPDLSFHPLRASDKHVHPLEGLIEFGPYSRSLINTVIDPIRIATVAPRRGNRRVAQLLGELEREHRPKERKTYLPPFPGFSRVFGVRVVSSTDVTIELDEDSASHDCFAMANQMSKVMRQLAGRRTDFDVAMVYLPAEWSQAYRSADGEFDLHDYIKALGAQLGVPTQIVGDGQNQALVYFCRCSVAWRLSIALYTKAGGVPWKMVGVQPGAAYIGLSYAIRGRSEGGRFVTCCSQVFDSDGAGLEFVAYEAEDYKVVRDNPYLSRAEMRRIMARSLSLYQRRHAGRSPTSVTVYKSTDFRTEETEGCFDAFPENMLLTLLSVQTSTIWRGVEINKNHLRKRSQSQRRGTASRYPCERGIALQLGAHEALIWTQGNSPEATGGRNYFKEDKGIPSPLLVKRHAGMDSWSEITQVILGLTKMNWNNDGLYDRLPVTLSFAQSLANIVKRFDRVASRPYPIRFFI